MKTKSPILGLTMGDPAGIGPEICLRVLGDPAVHKNCMPVLFGDREILERVAKKLPQLPRPQQFQTLTPAEFAAQSVVTQPVIIDCQAIAGRAVRPGTISAECGRAGYIYIEKAIKAALAGKISGVATAPIHKEALRLSGVPHPGHTEIFTALTGTKRSCMMLYSEALTVSMVTTHIGYHEVPGKLSMERILNVIELTAQTMRQLLGRVPHIGVCGLNPHAGEHGLFGQQEEEKFVVPAVKKARQKKLKVTGPLVPDAVFTEGQRGKYDAIVTLYHDQGHIPFKMLAFDTGVNTTLGLPIIRTSVDHGTAFDIAWQGQASATSLLAALQVAARLAVGNPKGHL